MGSTTLDPSQACSDLECSNVLLLHRTALKPALNFHCCSIFSPSLLFYISVPDKISLFFFFSSSPSRVQLYVYWNMLRIIFVVRVSSCACCAWNRPRAQVPRFPEDALPARQQCAEIVSRGGGLAAVIRFIFLKLPRLLVLIPPNFHRSFRKAEFQLPPSSPPLSSSRLRPVPRLPRDGQRALS